MKTIAHFDQHKLGLISPEDREIDRVRKAARAVLTNDQGQIAIMHFTTTGAHKLPGGGIDDGEAIDDALRREVREETGWEVADIRELGIVEEDRYYCGLHQTSYCFIAAVTKFVGTNLTKGEIAEGMELRWVDDVEAAISVVNGNNEIKSSADQTGHDMMTIREVAILRAAQREL